jgi:hypothetical protein
MSKYHVTECPGCGLPFREGRSLLQHFKWSPAGCKQLATAVSTGIFESNPCLLNPPPDSSSRDSHPDADDNPNQDVESTGLPLSETYFAYSFPEADSDDPDTNEVVDSIQVNTEDHLQNVVAFPVAFSNAALHEVQLLKLL